VRSRAVVLGCAIDRLDMAATLDRCAALIGAGRPSQHVCVNAAKIVATRDDARMRAIVGRSDVVSADGQAIIWASKLLRDPLPERVAGIDLMHGLLARASREGWRVYFLGATEVVLATALQRFRERYSGLRIVGSHNGYFSDAESLSICSAIREVAADLVFVAMSSPRKEYWIADHLEHLGAALAIGVGGALDVEAGLARRAPRVMQRAGLEWAFRLAQEPRRLFRRYAVTNARFLGMLARALALREEAMS
jgi:N-acetylglucosaminyldiphosphoundecaprenol N-acetyl-beta-D-mannosaminyltransferase